MNTPTPADSPYRAPMTRTTGTVKWFSVTRGFGFIAADDGSADAFLHRAATRERSSGRPPAEGDRVEYSTEMKARGLAAFDVVVLAA